MSTPNLTPARILTESPYSPGFTPAGLLAGQCHPPGFSRWCRPEYVVISGGLVDGVETVEETYRQAGAEVFHTARVGAVRFVIESSGAVEVSSWYE